MIRKLLNKFKSYEAMNYYVFAACVIVYTICALGKADFSSANAAIVSEGLFTKDNLGLISACFYLFYAVGQVFGGRIVDKASPAGLVGIGLAGALAACFVVSSTNNYILILSIWCFSGLIQFAIWPACISVISTRLDESFRKKALLIFSFTPAAGTLLSYLVASIILISGNWHSIFSVTGILLLAVLIVWFLASKMALPKLDTSTIEKSAVKTKVPWKKIIAAGIIPILIGAFIKSALELGVKAWIPTMIMETYSVSASFSVFLTIFLTFVNVFGVFIAKFFMDKFKGNEIKAAALMFLMSIPFAVGLLAMKNINLFVAVFLMAVFTTLMTANTQIILIYVPIRFAKFGCVGTMSGLINAVAAFGTFVSTYAFGIIAENLGWTSTILSWVILAAIAFVTYMILSSKWADFIKE